MSTTHSASSTNGFELLEERRIPEINTLARLYRHAKSGAQLLSLINDDENKVFGIAFATPPTDSTGLPHILEHGVLCGSRKYPLKEPFVELIKGSLKTFVNAFTFPDKTIYPVASQNVKDFYNLVDVYLDAVFYPRITPWTLMQEGWHYELESKDAPLIFKGVVFNEMKGAYSSPDSVLGRAIQQTLLPDTTYGVDSGGDPAVIPDLTHEAYVNFHATYYHPSNARIVMYGDDDPAERLRYLDEWLSAFDRIVVQPDMGLQPRWSQPRRIVETYDAGDDADAQNKGYVAVNWLLTDDTDPETLLGLDILAHMLAGTPASPLRKALIDSGLGEDVVGGNMENDLREAFYSIGLKGIRPADADQIERLILDAVAHLAEHGFEQEQVEASLNTIEFRLREANFGGFPRGIVFMLMALQTWLYDGDPFIPLSFEQPLQSLKDRLNKGERVFADLLKKYFVDNAHRSTVILMPDAGLRAAQDARERARLDAARAAMTDADLDRIVADTQTLKKMQVTPDSHEALAAIPSLALGDLERKNKTIPIETSDEGGATVMVHDLFTNGIAYLDLALDMHALPANLVPYMGLFGNALLEMGTDKEDFVSLSRRIGRKTGGIHASALNTMPRAANAAPVSRFVLRGKSTAPHFDDLLGILTDVLMTPKLDNRERFRQIVLEEKAGVESGLVPGGAGYVSGRLAAGFNQAGWVGERTRGVAYLFFLRELAERVEKDWASVLADLRAVRQHLVARDGLVANVTLDAQHWGDAHAGLSAFLRALPAAGHLSTSNGQGAWPASFATRNEGLTIPAQVNYVGKASDAYALGFKLHGSWFVAQNWLRTTYLWERIRVQGGAYGGYCTFDHRSGVFGYGSYRDPNLLGTLANYDGVGAFLREHAPSAAEVERTIIGVIGNLDSYMLPDAKGYASMTRALAGETEPLRQQLRDEVLGTTPRDFGAFAAVADAVAELGRVVVMGSSQAIEKANAERGAGWLNVTKVL